MKNILFSSVAVVLLLSVVGCSGGGSGSEGSTGTGSLGFASTLSYSDPANDSTKYRFVKNTSASTAAKVVLDLVGPSGVSGRGITFRLSADASKADWVRVSSGSGYVENGVVFDLGSSTPQLVVAGVENGYIQASLAQKGQGNSRDFSGRVLARIALEKRASTRVNDVISLNVTDAWLLPSTGEMVAIPSSSFGVGSVRGE